MSPPPSAVPALSGLVTIGLGLGLALGLGACPDRTIAEVETTQTKVESKDIPVTINRDLDILFLIDKSPTMADEQASLAANFPRFMEVLSQIDGGLPNVHVGVISQDIGAGGTYVIGTCSGLGDNGRLLSTPRVPGCTPPNGAYISDTDPRDGGARIRNYTGSLADTFTCIASLGPSGCGFEQHLGSLRKALDHNPANDGFLRPNAYLAIIIISDEDDCTASNPHIYDPAPASVAELGPLADFRCFEWGWECDEGTMTRGAGVYTNCRPRTDSPYLSEPDEVAAFLKTLKADPRQIIVATLTGPNALSNPAVVETRVKLDTAHNNVPMVLPSCENGTQSAFPMPRISYFASLFPDRNAFYSLCNNDLRAGLTSVAQLIRRVIGNPCFEDAIDTTDLDPANPGLQPQCAVSEVTAPGSASPHETNLPRCKMADPRTPATDTVQPCWYVEEDLQQCDAFPTKLALAMYPTDRVTPADTHIVAQCVTR